MKLGSNSTHEGVEGSAVHGGGDNDPMELLPVAVEALYAALADFLHAFNGFLHRHVNEVVGWHIAAATEAAAAAAAPTGNAGKGVHVILADAATAASATTAPLPRASNTDPPCGHSDHPDSAGFPAQTHTTHSAVDTPVLALSNLDSLVFNTITFGLQELTAAVGEIARTARRMRHAELRPS